MNLNTIVIQPKPSAEHITKVIKQYEKVFFWRKKIINENYLKSNRLMYFLKMLSLLTKKINQILKLLYEILRDVCLDFVHIPKIGPLPYQISGQKLLNTLRLRSMWLLVKPHIKFQDWRKSTKFEKALYSLTWFWVEKCQEIKIISENFPVTKIHVMHSLILVSCF